MTATVDKPGTPAEAVDILVRRYDDAVSALREAVECVPVVVTVRPERGSMLHGTYGFEGSERDLRASGAVCAPFLSAAAARIAVLCCLGAGLDRGATAAALAPWDA